MTIPPRYTKNLNSLLVGLFLSFLVVPLMQTQYQSVYSNSVDSVVDYSIFSIFITYVELKNEYKIYGDDHRIVSY
jgi:hypothetical protein